MISVGALLGLAATGVIIGSSSSIHSTSVFVVDESFETWRTSPSQDKAFITGDSFGGWTVTKGNVNLAPRSYWEAFDGNQSMDLSGDEPGAIAQTFSLLSGRLYTIRFQVSGNPQDRPILKAGRVLVNGKIVCTFFADMTTKNARNMGYEEVSCSFHSIGYADHR